MYYVVVRTAILKVVATKSKRDLQAGIKQGFSPQKKRFNVFPKGLHITEIKIKWK